MSERKDVVLELEQEINLKGYKIINELIEKRISEQFYLDFKVTEESDYTDRKTLFDRDRDNLSKSISGFGNSEGGIIIWGVSTKDLENKELDYAKTIKKINGIENFRTIIESNISKVTLPSHKKVSNIILKEKDSDTSGILATIIQKSTDRPHQHIGDYKYYLRSGSSFQPVPHGILQGMFGRDPLPELVMTFTTSKPKIDLNNISVQIGIMIVNIGTGISKDIHGHARLWTPSDESTFSATMGDTKNYDYQQAFGVEFSYMSKIEHRLGYQQRTQPITLDLKFMPPFTRNFEVDLLIGGNNQAPCTKVISKTATELQEIYNKSFSELDPDYFLSQIWDTPQQKIKE